MMETMLHAHHAWEPAGARVLDDVGDREQVQQHEADASIVSTMRTCGVKMSSISSDIAFLPHPELLADTSGR